MRAEPEGKCWSGKFEEIVGSVAQSCSAPPGRVITMATGRGWLWSPYPMVVSLQGGRCWGLILEAAERLRSVPTLIKGQKKHPCHHTRLRCLLFLHLVCFW